MNHLESTFSGKNSFWRYLVMIISVFLVSNTIGALPLLAGLLARSMSDPGTISIFASNPNDYGSLGFSPNTMLVMMLFPFIAGLAAFIFLVRPLHSRSFTEVINGTGKIRWNRFIISFLVWLIFSALYFIIYLKLEPGNFSFRNSGMTVLILTVISLTMIPFQAALEEVIFRGYLMQGFTALAGNRWIPLVTTSLIFGLLHGLNPEVKEYGFAAMMPQYILFGLIFGIVTLLDDGIEAAIGAHAANNAFLCVMVTNKSSALQTAAVFEQSKIYPSTELLALLVVGAIFIFSLKAIFRWKDFSVIFRPVGKSGNSDTVN
jgi:membrane protease YdiL (CAAX protease family)